MSQAKEREIQSINERIDNLFEQEGSINREFPDKPSIHDLIYDELRNLNGAIASLNTTNDIYLKALVDNTGTTASNLKDVKHRLKEIIHLSGNVRDNTAVMSEHLETSNQQLDEINTNCYDTMTQLTDIKNSKVIDYNSADSLKFTKKEKQVLYLALATFVKDNPIGETLLDSNESFRNLNAKVKEQ